MLMLVSLQNGGLNQTTFLFLFFPRLFPWLLLLIISPTLREVWVPPLFFLALELRSTGVKYSSLPWNPLSFRASSYLFLFSSKIFLPEDSLLILWFTALGSVSVPILGGSRKYLCIWGRNRSYVPLFKFNVTSRKSTIFKFEAIWILNPSSLKALIIFSCRFRRIRTKQFTLVLKPVSHMTFHTSHRLLQIMHAV